VICSFENPENAASSNIFVDCPREVFNPYHPSDILQPSFNTSQEYAYSGLDCSRCVHVSLHRLKTTEKKRERFRVAHHDELEYQPSDVEQGLHRHTRLMSPQNFLQIFHDSLDCLPVLDTILD
jgi:hypothetical protein